MVVYEITFASSDVRLCAAEGVTLAQLAAQAESAFGAIISIRQLGPLVELEPLEKWPASEQELDEFISANSESMLGMEDHEARVARVLNAIEAKQHLLRLLMRQPPSNA